MVLIFPHCLNLIIKSLIFLTSQLYVRILSLESNIDSAGDIAIYCAGFGIYDKGLNLWIKITENVTG